MGVRDPIILHNLGSKLHYSYFCYPRREYYSLHIKAGGNYVKLIVREFTYLSYLL